MSTAAAQKTIWFFKCRHDGELSYHCADYGTEDHHEASRRFKHEYGYKVIGSALKQLSFDEYCGLIASRSIQGEHGNRVASAMAKVFFHHDFEG